MFAYLVIYNAILFLYKYCFPMWFLRHWIVCFVFRIKYLDIFKVVELTCDQHQKELVTSPSLEEIIHYDLWARKYAASLQESSRASPVLAWVKLALVGLYKVGPTWNGDVEFLPKISIFAKDGFAGFGKKRREKGKGRGVFSDCIINGFGENWAIVSNMYKNENRYLKCVPNDRFSNVWMCILAI